MSTSTTVRVIAPAQLRTRLASPGAPVLLDVRTPAEFEAVRLVGSRNVPLDQLRREAGRLEVVADVVVVCRSGARAREAARALVEAGLRDVEVLDGGLQAWEADGGDVEHGRGGAWAMERQVRLVAGGVVLTGVLASTVVPRAKWLAGGIGAGLTFSAVSDTCGMAAVLARAPWNRRGAAPTSLDEALAAR